MEMRTRTTASTVSGGRYWWSNIAGSTWENRAVVEYHKKTTLDFHLKEVRKAPHPLKGFLPPSDLEITEIARKPSRMNKGAPGLVLEEAVTDYSGTIAVNSTLYKARGTGARTAENNLLAVEILSRTNPFRTDYSIPVAIKELTDVSSMFRFVGKTFSSFIGGSYLNYKFGWDQFFKDMSDIRGAVRSISKRIREFDSLNEHGGLRRKVALGAKEIKGLTASKFIQSTLSLRTAGDVTLDASIRYWGSVRWVPKSKFSDVLRVLDEKDKALLALDQVFDLGELNAESLWNMIPFSWVIDYFFAVSDFLSVLRGQDYIEPHDLCIMRQYHHREDVWPTPRPERPETYSYGYTTVTVKSRDVWVPANVPPFQVRLLSEVQITNLTALVATFIGRVR